MAGKSWYLRLTEEDKNKMYLLWKDGMTTTELGRRFGVAQTTAWRICNIKLNEERKGLTAFWLG